MSDIASVPAPLTLAQLDLCRELLRRIAGKRAATYRQMAEQLRVEPETLKAFCLGRSTRPRGSFLSSLTVNLPRLQPFTDGEQQLSLELKRLILEVAGIEHNRAWQDGLFDFLQVSQSAVITGGTQLVGQYAFYRNYGNGQSILKSKLEIFPYDHTARFQPFEIRRKVFGQKERLSRGFIFQLHERTIMIAKIGENEGLITIYAQKPSADENISGVMLSMREGESAFAARVVMIRLTPKNRTLDGGYGLIDSRQLSHEIGDYAATISNALDQWATLQLLRL